MGRRATFHKSWFCRRANLTRSHRRDRRLGFIADLSDLIGGQNLPCLVACSPDADDKQCLSYPPPSDLSGRDKLGHLSFINFVVSCASDSCAYETFLRYNCIEAPTYDDDSDVSTHHPTATPPPPAKRGGKKTSASVTLLSVTFEDENRTERTRIALRGRE